MIELHYFVAVDGKCPFEIWFEGLDGATAAKVTVALARVGQGNVSNCKGVGQSVFECKIDWGPGYRVYFGRDGDRLVILLTGGNKKRQQRDIETAKEFWRDYNVAVESELMMVKTKSFQDLVQNRVGHDAAFAVALLREGIDTMLSGDVETGKAILRDYIKATVGFEELGEAIDTPPKSLIRMFGPQGNPQAKNLFGVIGYLQKKAGVKLEIAR